MFPSLTLLSWYDRYGRDLPWRKTRDAYRILVSEVMLQQTQVSRVILYYGRWLKQFPDWHTLAQATNSDIIRAWSGLGYNRRGLMLRDIAKTIDTQGEPESEEGWRALKGIGPYTAAALACFSLHKRTLPIDTNIRRVGARLWLGIAFPLSTDDDKIRQAAESFLPTQGRFYDIPQALFDLASLICTKSPTCQLCPLQEQCLAAPKFLRGEVEVPRKSIKKANESKHRDKPYPDRIYRGRILKVVQEKGSVSLENLGTLIDSSFNYDEDQAWILRMVDRMEKEGFINKANNNITLSS